MLRYAIELIKSDAFNLNQKNNKGETPLMLAAQKLNVNIALELSLKKADKSLKSNSGKMHRRGTLF